MKYLNKLLENGLTPFLHNCIHVRKMKDTDMMDMYIEDYLIHKKITSSEIKLHLEKEELMYLLNYILKEDSILIVGAPTERYNFHNASIISLKTQIKFDDATLYPELIEQANSQALFKDGLTNSNELTDGGTYKCWVPLSLLEIVANDELMFTIQRIIALLEPGCDEIELTSWFEKRALNNIENIDHYFINYNDVEDNYFVRREKEKTNKTINLNLYN